MDQPPQIPPAVIQFAEEHNIKNVQQDDIFDIKKHAYGYKTIDAAYLGISAQMSELEKTLPEYTYVNYMYILIDNDKIRLATPKELEELNRVLFL